MKYRVEVSLKPGVLDAEGNAAADGLRALGFRVGRVSFSKTYLIECRCGAREVEEMCRRLLANPIINDYSIQKVKEKKREKG